MVCHHLLNELNRGDRALKRKRERQRERQRLFSSRRRQISTDSISNYLFGRDAAIRIGSTSRSNSSGGRSDRSMVADALNNVLDQHGISSNYRNDQNDDDDDDDDDDNIEMDEQEVDAKDNDDEEAEDDDGTGEDGEVEEHGDVEEEKGDDDDDDDENDENDDHQNDEEEEDEEGMLCEEEDDGVEIAPEDDEKNDSDEADDQSHHVTSNHQDDAMVHMNNVMMEDVVMADDDDDDEEHVLGGPVVGQFDDTILVVDEVGDGDDEHVHIHTSNAHIIGNRQGENANTSEPKNEELSATKASDDRKNTYISACMEFLQAQHPILHHHHHTPLIPNHCTNRDSLNTKPSAGK